MNKRDKAKVKSKPFPHNDQIFIHYEFEHGKDTIVPGDKILFKNTRGRFKFVKFVENKSTDVSWIDCIEEKTHTFRSFYADRLKAKVKPKRQRSASVKQP